AGSIGTLASGQTVNPAATSTTISSSLDPSVFGQDVTFTATVSPVSPGAGMPGGTVQFFIDGSPYGSPALLTAGSATTSANALSSGPHTVIASYSGDGNFTDSSGTVSQGVDPASTSTD